MEFDQTSTDTSLGLGKEVIRFWWPWSHFHFETQILIEKACVHTISWTNDWNFTKLAHIHHYYRGKKWLDFGELDLIFKSLHYKDSKKGPCVHFISWINRWNLTKLAQLHHWDGGMKWLDFGDLDLIFKSLHYKDSKNEPCVHSISWIIGWNLTKLAQLHHWDGGIRWLDFGDLDLIFKVTPTLWNSNFDRKKACVHTVFWTNDWNFTKLAQIHLYDRGKKWLYFGDLDLIFKVTTFSRSQSNFDRKELVCILSLEPMARIWPN